MLIIIKYTEVGPTQEVYVIDVCNIIVIHGHARQILWKSNKNKIPNLITNYMDLIIAYNSNYYIRYNNNNRNFLHGNYVLTCVNCVHFHSCGCLHALLHVEEG